MVSDTQLQLKNSNEANCNFDFDISGEWKIFSGW